MMKFRFYVVRQELADVFGTDDEDIARSYACSYDYYVIDAKHGVFLNAEGDEDVKELNGKWEYAEEDSLEDDDWG